MQAATWGRGLRQRVRDFITAVSSGPWPGMREQAARLLKEIPDESLPGPGARRAAAAPAGGVDKSALPFAVQPHASKKERRSARNVMENRIRYAVLTRARGICEFACGVGEPAEAHHVLGGSSRVAEESEWNQAAVCEDCHKHAHESPAWAREQGLKWARRMELLARAVGDLKAEVLFAQTAEQLEARIALAAAQEREPA